jgi:DNA invertase Pin-like site-specific DNA recombinase
MKVRGYTRPLFAAEDTDADVRLLRELGVVHITVETVHTTVGARSRLIRSLSRGDRLVVTSLERIDPRLDGVIRCLVEMGTRGVHLRCADMPHLDTTVGPASDTLAALADYTTRSSSRATQAALSIGRKPGRPPALDELGVEMALELWRMNRSVDHIARVLGVSNGVVRRVIESADRRSNAATTARRAASRVHRDEGTQPR